MMIVAAGIVARLVMLALFDPMPALWAGDTPDYLAEAAAIQHGHLPTVKRTLGYPLFLAATLPLGTVAVLVIQCAISVGTALATYVLLGRTRLALLAAMAFATLPFLAIFDFQLKSESLYVNLLWLGFLCLHARKYLAAGVGIGLSMLVRDTLVLLPFALLPLVIRQKRVILTIGIAALIGLLPMTLRSGEGRLGLNLWIGTWERNGDWYQAGLQKPAFPSYAFKLPGERQAIEGAWLKDDGVLKSWAARRIAGDPVGTATAWALRYPRLWVGTRVDSLQMRIERSSPLWTAFKAGFFGLNLIFLALGVWGIVRRRPNVLAVPVAYIAAIYLPFHNVETRYSLAALPFLLYFGCGVFRRADA